MAVGSSAGGWLSDVLTTRHGNRVGRCFLAAGGIGFAALFIALGTRVASAQTAVIYLAAGAGSLYVSQSSFWSVSADIGKKSAGSVSGIINMGAQTGSAITASLTPWLDAPLRLEHVVPGRGRPLRLRSRCLVVRQSELRRASSVIAKIRPDELPCGA